MNGNIRCIIDIQSNYRSLIRLLYTTKLTEPVTTLNFHVNHRNSLCWTYYDDFNRTTRRCDNINRYPPSRQWCTFRFKLLLFFYRQKFLSLSWRDKQHHVYDLNGKMNEFKKTGYSLVNHVALNHSDIEIVLTGCWFFSFLFPFPSVLPLKFMEIFKGEFLPRP